MTVTIDPERFRESFERYSRVGATDHGGLHRLALSDADREARDLFVADLEELGLEVRVDEVGNIFGRRPGREDDLAPVLIGSHLDSQPYGGRYDGQLGVLTALETLRALEDEQVETRRPVEIVNWTNEEGARFQPSMLGSGVFVGKHSLEDALAVEDRDGTVLGDELERIGYDGDAECGGYDVHSFLELHVEQGPTLESEGTPVGIVDGVFGLYWARMRVEGEADHAGPTPMHTRTDALQAATGAIDRIGTIPQHLSPDAVVTVGEVSVHPNSINVIPSEVTFTVDLRSFDDGVIEEGIQRVTEELDAACNRHGTTYEVEELQRHQSMNFSPTVRSAIDDASGSTGVEAMHLLSGAGHDAQHMDAVTDAGMIFVPSVGGETHNEAEYTEWEDAVDGAKVYAATTLNLATE
ncbi:allantoate amidohydrolase [Halobacterium sp. DL1]|jgi:N-carbamoyl-L-amino-acid hydrolase|nr:allantoate amidohydrolase [Halobacterium sp. DL1]